MSEQKNTEKRKGAAARFYQMILAPACCFFALIVFAVTLIGVSINSGRALSPRALIGFFVFSLLLAVLNRIFFVRSLPTGLKLLIHYVGFAAGFFISFFLIAFGISNAVGGLYVILILTVVYFIAAGIVFAVRAARRKNGEEKEKYEKQFR